MNTKIKSLLLAAFLLMTIGVKAQEAGGYEFAIIEGGYAYTKVTITKSNGEEKIDVPKNSNGKIELLKKVEEMSKEGWQAYSTDVIQNNSVSSLYSNILYLRRKIK